MLAILAQRPLWLYFLSESTKLTWKPNTTTELDLDGAQKLMRLIEVLEDDDDVQRVTANFDISDEVMEQLSAE